MAAVPGEALDGFRHEAGRDAEGGAKGFDGVFEETGAVGHARDFAVFERGFVDAGAGLGVPAFDVDVEFLACYMVSVCQLCRELLGIHKHQRLRSRSPGSGSVG